MKGFGCTGADKHNERKNLRWGIAAVQAMKEGRAKASGCVYVRLIKTPIRPDEGFFRA